MTGRFRSGMVIMGLLLAVLFIQARSGQVLASSPTSDTTVSAPGIHLAMLFNNNEHDKSVETGKIDYVWGADSGWAMKNAPALGVQHAWYSFFDRDTEDNSNHDLAWFQSDHPDWIEYQCDRTTALQGNGWVQYDITNPAVQQYELSLYRASHGWWLQRRGLRYDRYLQL